MEGSTLVTIIATLFSSLIMTSEATHSPVQGKCAISLPQHTSKACRANRQQGLAKQRAIYQIQAPPTLPTPLVNMSVAKVVDVLRKDPFAKYHLDLYRQIVGFDRELFKIWLNFKQGKIGEFTDYNRIYDFFFSKQEKFGGDYFRTPSDHEPFQDVINNWMKDQVFTEQRLAGLNPMSLQRVTLHGQSCESRCKCPKAIRCLKSGQCLCRKGWTGPNAQRVRWGRRTFTVADNCNQCAQKWWCWAALRTAERRRKCRNNSGASSSKNSGLKLSALEPLLNKKFDWDKAVRNVLGSKISFKSTISAGHVFALRYPLCDKVVNVYPDITEPDPKRKVWDFKSPIAFFVSKPNKRRNKRAADLEENRQDAHKPGPSHPWWGPRRTLVPLAIQMDYQPDSPVYTPKDGDSWTLAKLNLQVTDYGYNQLVEHLLKVHLLMEPFCVVLKRHLSHEHPLHQMLKFHCRGILVANSLGAPNLLLPFKFTHQILAFGDKGSNQLVVTGYEEASWDDTDFEGNIKKRGLDDRGSLPYFPYRDDGHVIYDAIEDMVDEYIGLYYHRDNDVINDVELQAYVNEISADGTGPDGGRGKLKGFPAKVETRKMLVNIMTRLVWQLSAQHAAVNYPIPNYAAYTPLTPTKLYSDPRVKPGQFKVYNLPNGNISAIQASLSLMLGTFRYDSLFDYSDKLDDSEAGDVVFEHFLRLHRDVNPLLVARNEKRLEKGHLTYPYFLPRWLPNGVQT